eukprot:4100134-Amphidinium_carterae.1
MARRAMNMGESYFFRGGNQIAQGVRTDPEQTTNVHHACEDFVILSRGNISEASMPYAPCVGEAAGARCRVHCLGCSSTIAKAGRSLWFRLRRLQRQAWQIT